MASISNDGNGLRRIQYVGPDGRRRAIRLGRVSERTAQQVRAHVENLVSAKATGHAVPRETASWLAADAGEPMLTKLAAVGLIQPREAVLLKPYLAAVLASRGDVKASTKLVMGHVERNLLDYFGEAKDLRTITPGDADAWRLWLVTNEKLAAATVSKRAGMAKAFFRPAARRKLIDANPFEDIKRGSQANSSREYFVSTADARKVLDHCPDDDWRLMFALARFGGLRVPSEPLGLRWADVDW